MNNCWCYSRLFSRRVFGEEHSETLACQEHFVELYEAWGKPEKAEEWRTKLPVVEDTQKSPKPEQ